MSPPLANDGASSLVMLLAVLLAMMLLAVIRAPEWDGSPEEDALPAHRFAGPGCGTAAAHALPRAPPVTDWPPSRPPTALARERPSSALQCEAGEAPIGRMAKTGEGRIGTGKQEPQDAYSRVNVGPLCQRYTTRVIHGCGLAG
jgi:hypothetical protein